MGIYSGYMLVSDIDGTLSCNEVIPEGNYKAIAEFEKEGGIFVIASGRYPTYPEQKLKLTVNAPVIAMNGAVIYDTKANKLLYDVPLGKKELDIAKDAILHFGDRTKVIVNCIDTAIPCKTPEELEAAVLHGEKVAYKFLFLGNDEKVGDELCAYLRKKYGSEVNVFKSWTTLTEIIPKGSGKAECLPVLKKLFPSVHTVVAAGDYENDVKMLRAADIGYAMENAIPEAKEAADRMAPNCRDNAIAFVIKDMIK